MIHQTISSIDHWLGRPDGCFIIAEVGVNHNGHLDLARQLIDVAADSGADAVKFQTFSAEALVTRSAAKAAYQVRNDSASTRQYDMLKALELSPGALEACKAHCKARGIRFLSTPFDEASADLLSGLGVDGFKVSSGDLTHLPFLQYLAAKGLPIILSTGMAVLAEVEDAVASISAAGAPPIALLHCVSDYPAAPEDANLLAMVTLHQAFGCPVGWSDHTLGSTVSIAAAALGARIIEKHITLDKGLPGPDHAASADPAEFASFVAALRVVEQARGDGIKRPRASELATRDVARRSIVAAFDLPAGTLLNLDHLAFKRPGTGLAPKHAGLLTGRRTCRDIAADTVLSMDDTGPTGP